MHEYVILDVFTRVPLEGNPLAVFLDGSDLDSTTMQRAARELNLSETVFLSPGENGTDARLRIFTPSTEMPFAGHPVLGAAYVVGERSDKDELQLLTGAGVVPVALRRQAGEIVDGEMDQPLPVVEEFLAEAELLRALGVERSDLPLGAYRNGPLHLYVQLPDVAAVTALRPDLGALGALGALGVSCFAVAEGHVETRNFAPGLGVAEDPATGSAAGPLALHLARHRLIDYGQEIEIHQGVAMGRPSVLRARVHGSPSRLERVVVGGSAVRVAEGRFILA